MLEEKDPVSKHDVIREKARLDLQSGFQDDKSIMQKRRVTVQEFAVGDQVSLAIPKLDRGSTDLSRLPGL